ncbi:PREDICTED: sentrin-specific protease 8-like [Ceratosolen solmsi marchali]|uniref:Sentrin-specific protease 8-like n=1 Tax=Ceratosolen solmsi marchali TaxID=326594 RepID=A0AAJ6YUT2_9HYME|nr:PREDICTED: sentrin-specific protease 8-like [Ceratosolen solmsi marchali]
MALQDNVDDVFLSYNNSLIRQGDVNLLRGPYWLNDTIIGFYFEFLEDKYEALMPEALFVCPELTQLLKVTASNEYSALLDPIKAKEKNWIFFPLNDCSSLERPGGTHWSLLVFSKVEKSCFHYDSSRGLNTSIAKDLSKKIMHYLLGNSDGNFIEIDCPQQDNSYDCGLFVLYFADNIPIHIQKKLKISFDFEFIQEEISYFRTVLLILVQKLKYQQL